MGENPLLEFMRHEQASTEPGSQQRAKTLRLQHRLDQLEAEAFQGFTRREDLPQREPAPEQAQDGGTDPDGPPIAAPWTQEGRQRFNQRMALLTGWAAGAGQAASQANQDARELSHKAQQGLAGAAQTGGKAVEDLSGGVSALTKGLGKNLGLVAGAVVVVAVVLLALRSGVGVSS